MRSPSNASVYGNPLLLRRAFGEKREPRRIYERVKCELWVAISVPGAKNRPAEGRFLNLGMGGAYLNCAAKLEKNIVYDFQIGRLLLSGHIARLHGPEKRNTWNYGVNFVLTAKQETQLKMGLDALRQAQSKPSSIKDGKLKWYWGA